MANTQLEIQQDGLDSSDMDQYLTFILSGDEFAVPIMQVKEIIEYCELTRIPRVPDFIRGAINLRGSVVPVVDLAAQFGLATGRVTKRTCIVVIEVMMEGVPSVMGAVVDKVLQVVDIADGDIEPPPNFGARIRTEFIQGMARMDERFTIVLDVNRVLSAEEIAIIGRMNGESEFDEQGTKSVPEQGV